MGDRTLPEWMNKPQEEHVREVNNAHTRARKRTHAHTHTHTHTQIHTDTHTHTQLSYPCRDSP